MPDGASAPAEGVLAALFVGQEALRREVEALRRDVAALATCLNWTRGQVSSDDTSLPALAQAIGRALGGNVWTLVDLAHLAALEDAALAQALARWPSLRALGRCLARAARRGRPIAGYILERVGRDRDGGIWRLSPAESHAPRCPSSSPRSRCSSSIPEK